MANDIRIIEVTVLGTVFVFGWDETVAPLVGNSGAKSETDPSTRFAYLRNESQFQPSLPRIPKADPLCVRPNFKPVGEARTLTVHFLPLREVVYHPIHGGGASKVLSAVANVHRASGWDESRCTNRW